MFDQTSFLKRLQRSDSLLDVLIQVEDVLDSMDMYAFKNWFEGEVVDGPHVSRYWVTVTLKYPYKKMPDPQGGMRLVFHGAKVFYQKAEEEKPIEVKSPSDVDEDGHPKMEKKKIWLVTLKIPRRFIDELDDSEIEAYDDELEDINVDVDDVSDARDEGVEDDSDVFEQEPEEEDLEI